MASKKLYRSCSSRVVAGICGGLGQYFDVDPVLIRLLFVISIIAGGLGVIVYFISWLVIPNDPKCETENFNEEVKEVAHNVADTVKNEVQTKKNDSRAIVGIAILVLGILILIRNITGLQIWSNLWHMIFIIIGLYIIFRKGDK